MPFICKALAMNRFYKFLILFYSISPLFTFAQPCPSGKSEVLITVLTDALSDETAWTLIGSDGAVYGKIDYKTYKAKQFYVHSICVPDTACLTFTIKDSYGDGINKPGYYSLRFKGIVLDSVAPGTIFTSRTTSFNCSAGTTCGTAFPIKEGNFTTPFSNTWYKFIPDSVGNYQISTCGNSCDTRLWIYSTCNGTGTDTTLIGALYFNDNNSVCGEQAILENVILNKNQTYYIRVGVRTGSICQGGIKWKLQYQGPVRGCTDPKSCNYDPLATVDDGSCLTWGNPNCKSPDLLLNEEALRSSSYLDTITNKDGCLISEGCINGFGVRDIIRFSTKIQNKGELDFFIGDSINNPKQFSYDNCHKHQHYVGYAEYLLFNEKGELQPSAYKNGFCLVDYECFGGKPKFSCEKMGISAQCGDIYPADYICQWIDATNLKEGKYTMVARVNWANKSDALGRKEKDSLNNWAQLCFDWRRINGKPIYTQLGNCPIYKDCLGNPYGNAQIDCEGNCNGTALSGDINRDGVTDNLDIASYLYAAVNQDTTSTVCTDLSGDGKLSLFDASLLLNCNLYGSKHSHPASAPHNHCIFPLGVINKDVSASLRVLQVNTIEKYADIGLRSPDANIGAVQFRVKGATVQSAKNLYHPGTFNLSVLYSPQTNVITTLSILDSSILRSNEYIPVLRVYYNTITEKDFCIESIEDIINDRHEKVIATIEGTCLPLTTSLSDIPNSLRIEAYPNPSSGQMIIRFQNLEQSETTLRFYNQLGQEVYSATSLSEQYILEEQVVPKGIYYCVATKNKVSGVIKLIMQ